MYIKQAQTYYDGTEQCVRRQWFLLLVQTTDNVNDIRAIVRKVALRQFGHWMMGYAMAFDEMITVSGSYGGDGLPVNVSQKTWDRAMPLPSDLYDAWNSGGGWNSAGSEAPLMRQWAIENFKKLAPRGATS